jgi:hypothetical protein
MCIIGLTPTPTPEAEVERDRRGIVRHSNYQRIGLASVALNEEGAQPNRGLGPKQLLVALTQNAILTV